MANLCHFKLVFSAFWQGFILTDLIILKYVSCFASWDTWMLFGHSILLWFVVLVLLLVLVFVVFLNRNHLHFSWEFSLLTPSATCDSCALTGSFLCWAGCGSSAALLFCARIPKGESGDERCIKVTLKSTVPSAFWSLCCYGAMSSNISYWWIFAKLLCYWFLTVKKVPLLLYWHKCLEYMHCNS